MITRYDGSLYVDHDLEDPALRDRTDDPRKLKSLTDWPVGDLVMRALVGRDIYYEFETFESALLDTMALELHALRGALELGQVTTDQNVYSDTFTKHHAAHFLNLMIHRTNASVIIAQRIAAARLEPPPEPKPCVPPSIPAPSPKAAPADTLDDTVAKAVEVLRNAGIEVQLPQTKPVTPIRGINEATP